MDYRSFSARAFISLSMSVCFVALSVSGIVFYLSPHGPRAKDWMFLSLAKNSWENIHIVFGFLFIAAGLCHLWLNRKPMLSYFHRSSSARKSGENTRTLSLEPFIVLAMALVITAVSIIAASSAGTQSEKFRGYAPGNFSPRNQENPR